MGMFATDNDGPFVILQGRGYDLRGGRGKLVHQNDEWTVVFDVSVVVVQDPDLSAAILDLNNGSGLDEQPGDIDGIGQRSAAIIAQIKNNPFKFVFF
jgi:hypothetical protein